MKKDTSDLESDLSRLKSDFSKPKSDTQVARNINSKLSGRLVTMERRCYTNEQYCRRECLEILSISANVADNRCKSKVLESLE